jgi:hypothetical protein
MPAVDTRRAVSRGKRSIIVTDASDASRQTSDHASISTLRHDYALISADFLTIMTRHEPMAEQRAARDGIYEPHYRFSRRYADSADDGFLTLIRHGHAGTTTY